MEKIANALLNAVDDATARWRSVTPEKASHQPAPGKWSIQEIVGHLVDSAANNHQRFVRAQQQDPMHFPKYEQDAWVSSQGYCEADWPELLELWRLYNRHLAAVIRRVPADRLGATCHITPLEPVTLQFLIEDYLDHLLHHANKIDEMISAQI